MSNKNNNTFIFMGVSGSGKSAVAKQVAYDLDAAFLDGDFLHPKANILKMRSGIPLTDEDRKPWLALINNAAFAMTNVNEIAIIVCSSLKQQYRDIIRNSNENIHFIYLKGSIEIIAARLAKREGHYQKIDMLQSQFDTLEEPDTNEKNIHLINVDKSLSEIITEVKRIIQTVVNTNNSD